MPDFALSIPTDADNVQVNLSAGEFLFVLGPNGSGKSGLIQAFNQQENAKSRRLSAHRQTFMQSGDPNITAQQHRDYERNVQNYDANPQARWKDDYAPQRAQVAIFNLISSENVKNREIARAVRSKKFADAEQLGEERSPLGILNELLRASNMPIEISIGEDDRILASKNGGSPYSVAELSDGERNALMLACYVLTAVPGTLFLIDEPERHLHRSIISPLLGALFAERVDCAFVVSTHDIETCHDHKAAKILLVRDCKFSSGSPTSWDVDLVSSVGDIDDDLRREILGCRRTILYVEGSPESMDMQLYSLLFPGISVVPKENCREVERAVHGLRSSDQLHWLKPYGLIDGDGRSEGELEALQQQGIFSVKAYSVESVYYHPDVFAAIAKRRAELLGGSVDGLLQKAVDAALTSLPHHSERLAQRIAEKNARSRVLALLPTKEDIVAGKTLTLELNCEAIVAEEREVFDHALAEKNLPLLLKRYPLRETPALNEIAKNLGLGTREDYESAVRHAISQEQALLSFIQSLFEDLVNEISLPPQGS